MHYTPYQLCKKFSSLIAHIVHNEGGRNFKGLIPGIDLIKLLGVDLLTLFVSYTILELRNTLLTIMKRPILQKIPSKFTPKSFMRLTPGVML